MKLSFLFLLNKSFNKVIFKAMSKVNKKIYPLQSVGSKEFQ